MAHFAPYLVGGVAAVLLMDYVPAVSRQVGNLAPSLLTQVSSVQQSERSRKGDRLAAPRTAQPQSQIATDPASNVTIVSKGLLLPETVRQHAGNAVKPVPVDLRDRSTRDLARDRKAPAPRKVPLGCEPSFSPVAQPSMAHITGRCVAEWSGSIKLAMR